jgi:hypothetical protein
MEIELKKITVRELTDGFTDDGEAGVVGYGGQLDIRPPYQREFVYKDKQRDAVIDTVSRAFPLNVMYWAVRNDGNFEVIDGQQRTISLCQFIQGDFSVSIGSFDQKRAFHNLQKNEQEALLNYELMIYVCSGSDSEKLEWFKTINIAGEELTQQELRNAVYHGPWVSDAKKYFSRSNCPAYGLGKDYLSGAVNRQDFLETVIKWISLDGNIEGYMSDHQDDQNAQALWEYFRNVIGWTVEMFPKYRKEMKGVEWGFLFNDHSNETFDFADLELKVASLMADEDVSNKKGIYRYVFDRKERHLSIRSFTENQKREAYERQGGKCPVCSQCFEIGQMEADHITPWHEGGKTNAANCQMLCKDDNRRKSGK